MSDTTGIWILCLYFSVLTLIYGGKCYANLGFGALACIMGLAASGVLG